MGGTSGTYGDRRGVYMILVVNLTKRDDFVDLGLDGKIILKYIFKEWDKHMEWFDLAQDRDRRRALMNAVMNIRLA
jgi:hypothetical protein